MSWNSRSVAVAKEKQVGKSKTGRVVEEEEGEKENSSKRVNVTRELQIKAISNKEGKNMEMDKEVVLRRIRQRKRVNKLRAALQALVSSPFSKTTTHNHNHSWLDDPFAAL